MAVTGAVLNTFQLITLADACCNSTSNVNRKKMLLYFRITAFIEKTVSEQVLYFSCGKAKVSYEVNSSFLNVFHLIS